MSKICTDEKQAEAALSLLLIKYSGTCWESCRKKKTPFQLDVLKAVYNITVYPSTITKNNLKILLRLSYRTINVWFQNERQTTCNQTYDRFFKKERCISTTRLYNIYCLVLSKYKIK